MPTPPKAVKEFRMKIHDSFLMYIPNDAPTWMTGIVMFAAIIMDTFMYEDSRSDRSVAPAPIEEVTNRPIDTAPLPEPAKLPLEPASNAGFFGLLFGNIRHQLPRFDGTFS